MRYVVTIKDRLLSVLTDREIETESSSAMQAHKDIYFSELSEDESIIEIRDESGHIVYEAEDGFADGEIN
jgi:hypothetical protein